MQPSPQQQAVAQVYALLLENNTDMALALAEEILADSEHEFKKSTSQNTASAVVMSATAYAEARIKCRNPRQAIATLLNAMSQVSEQNPDQAETMTACITLWHAMEAILSQSSPDTRTQREAIERTTASLASLLYMLYYSVGKSAPMHPALSDAYQTLRLLSSLVEIDRQPRPISALIADIQSGALAAGLI